MNITCKYSGVVFKTQYFSNLNLVNYHPIFSFSARDLLVRARDWRELKLDPIENKLLFLALLNKTESVVFTHPANPSPRTIQSNMQAVFKLLGDTDLFANGTIILPKYVISADNYLLDNVHNWIDAWFGAKKEWLQPSHRRHLASKLLARELVLDRLIHSPYKKSEQYAGRLASWAMDAGNVPVGLKEYWTGLFKLKDSEIYNTRIIDLEELLEHMECNLYNGLQHLSSFGSSYADKTLEHLRGILKKARAGRIGSLDDGSFFSITDDDTGEVSYQSGNATEQFNKKLAASHAPSLEPKLGDYQGKLMQYMKDKAAWRLAQNLLQKTTVKYQQTKQFWGAIIEDPESNKNEEIV